MDLELAGRVIIVTGGASGIGAAIVRLLEAEGAVPVVFDRAEAPESLQRTHWHRLDLTDSDACASAVGAVIERHDRIDGLVNNAGLNDRAGLDVNLATGLAAFRTSLERNLVPVYVMMSLCLDRLRRSHGAVVNIASKVAIVGQGQTSGYAAAKGGMLALTREWAAELAADGIRVNAVLPAEVATPMHAAWLQGFADPDARLKEITDRIPLGRRMTTPEEIAAMAVFLLSARAGHITGQHEVVDGGYVHLDRAIA
jgi:L-fucose dehydrogenase